MKTKLESSVTAKRGFRNENYVALKFNSWQEDEDARQWLRIMGYDLEEIESVRAEKSRDIIRQIYKYKLQLN